MVGEVRRLFLRGEIPLEGSADPVDGFGRAGQGNVGTGSVFTTEATEGLFFSSTAVVTFDGAYAVLAYVAQQAVQTYGRLSADETVRGLGLAETTPGPLIGLSRRSLTPACLHAERAG
ncbi:chromate transporter [Streptomyces sp. NPDC051662]|uniref:chromate transporter n=1 Tax=Streptomyces sp. NPDC051662 TaxID=3154750 RepID=UPI00343BD2F6